MNVEELPVAVHRSCYEIHFRLYQETLQWENPALSFSRCIALDDIRKITVRCDGPEKLRVQIRCARSKAQTITVLDNEEGDFLLTRLCELTAQKCPTLQISGMDFKTDARTALKATQSYFVIFLVLLIAGVAISCSPVSIPIKIGVVLAALATLLVFWIKRSAYRELLAIAQEGGPLREDEKAAIVMRARELEAMSRLEPEEKTQAQQVEIAEEERDKVLLTSGKASFAVMRTASAFLARRHPDAVANFQEENAERENKTTSTIIRFSVPEKELYHMLKLTVSQATSQKLFPGLFLTVKVENTGDQTVDGFVLGRIRHEGTVVGTVTLPLPPGGIAPNTSTTLFGTAELSVPWDETAVVWFEPLRLWSIGA